MYAYTKTTRYPVGTFPDSRQIEFYRSKHPGRCIVRIKSEGLIAEHGRKIYQGISTATFDLDTAKQLRNALDLWIKENA